MMSARELLLPPASKSYVEGIRRYELQVEQQPRRARMCGFGDKDRRPITPPPCVKLKITDVHTGKEVAVNELEHGMFVLNVDLWSADGSREVNLVRSSTASLQIPASVPPPYGLESSAPAYPILQNQQATVRDQRYDSAYGQAPRHNPYSGPSQGNPYPQNQNNASTSGYPPQYVTDYHQTSSYPPQNDYPGQYTYSGGQYKQETGYSPVAESLPSAHSVTSLGERPFTPSELNARLPMNAAQPTGMFTRNLIGSLAASAFRLTDPCERIGIWFVLQDLSVRTEGSFRLRFSFVNVAASSSPPNASNPPQIHHPLSTSHPKQPMHQQLQNQSSLVNTGKAPVLASCFSDVFTVYSAKKFPGVVESTGLSKCFATQGIKIPIRKDAQGGKGRSGPGHGGGDDFDDDD